MQWCFSQVKGAIDDDVAEGKSSAKIGMFKSQISVWNCYLLGYNLLGAVREETDVQCLHVFNVIIFN